LIGWDPESLRSIADLCLYQIKRLEKDTRERITHLVAEGNAAGKSYKQDLPYELGSEFP
jgi:hypothetical protein